MNHTFLILKSSSISILCVILCPDSRNRQKRLLQVDPVNLVLLVVPTSEKHLPARLVQAGGSTHQHSFEKLLKKSVLKNRT